MRIPIIAALLMPAALSAQAPIRLSAGACQWQSRNDAAWGHSVRAFSTQYDTEDWAATQILGQPNVFPRYGDIPGTWGSSSTANLSDYVEVMFERPVMAGEIWVFETLGMGSVYMVSAINPDGSVTPIAAATPRMMGSEAAHIVVPVEPARQIAGVRFAASSALTETFAEVDAVAAVPDRMCSRGQTFLQAGSGVRMPPSAVPLPAPANAVWATAVTRYSSQRNTSGNAAAQAIGAPDGRAWEPGTTDAALDLVVLQFPPTLSSEIWIYESSGAGGVWLVEDDAGSDLVALWAETPSRAASESGVLRITLPRPRQLNRLRLMTSPQAVSAFTAIDAVALVPAAAR